MMDELLKTLAAQTGVELATAKNGLGAILAFLKDQLPEGLFGEVDRNLPGAAAVADSFQPAKADEAGGGLLGTVAGMAGKIFGGAGAGGVAGLMAMLAQAGLSVDQIKGFLPKAVEMLQAYLPADLVEKVKGLVLPAGSGE